MGKRYLRKKHLKERYNTSERNIDRMSRDGRLPPPDMYLGRFPVWDEEKLDENDRAAAKRPRQPTAA